MSQENNKNLYDDDISKTQQLELDRYQKYLKSIKKYDPLDEEEYLYLTNEMNQLITNNDKLSDIEVLELTKKLEKIDNTKDYTIELLELTKEIKKITSPVKKTNSKQYKADIPKVDKKVNPKKEQIKPLTSTSILPKINNSKKKEEKIAKQEDKKIEEGKKTVCSGSFADKLYLINSDAMYFPSGIRFFMQPMFFIVALVWHGADLISNMFIAIVNIFVTEK